MLFALLFALTIDPPASDPADTPTAAHRRHRSRRVRDGHRKRLGRNAARRAAGLPNVLPEEEPSPALRFVWRDHPSISAGRNLRLDFGVKVQEDARDPGDDPTNFPTWNLHRLRAGVDGEVFRKFQFSIEREFSENLNNDPNKKSSKSQWKDFYGEYNSGGLDADPRRQVQDPLRPRSDER